MNRRRLLDRANDLLVAQRDLVHEVSQMTKCELGHVDVVFSPIVADMLLGPILRYVATNKPMLRVRVELTSSAHLLEYLVQEKIEFFVADTGNIAPSKRLAVRRLARVICLVSLARRTLSPAAVMIIERVEEHLAERSSVRGRKPRPERPPGRARH